MNRARPAPRPAVRALVFDVFGTVVDWRTSIAREAAALAAARGAPAHDWPGFADAWRAGYRPAMDEVRRGELPWTDLDTLHRRILDRVLAERGLAALFADEADRRHLVAAWHRLDPWPDSAAGLQRLRRRLKTATLSNGHVALLVNLSRHGGLAWDTVLSAELFGHYKPDPEVYLGAARLLGHAPAETMMVACHPSDLRAAARCGLATAYVRRPAEHGVGGPMEPMAPGEFDLEVDDFGALADALEAAA